jgi:transposase
MRISKKAMTPILSEKIKNILTQMTRSRTISASLNQRSSIVLLASLGKSNKEISQHLNIHHNCISKWRMRFMESLSILQAIEISEPEKLQDAIKYLLSDKPRPGTPATYTQEQIVKIIDLACKLPSDFGYEVSHWSLNILVKEIIKQGISETMSAKSVSRFLKGSGIKTSQVSLLASFN